MDNNLNIYDRTLEGFLSKKNQERRKRPILRASSKGDEGE